MVKKAVVYCSIIPGQDNLYLDYQEKILLKKLHKLNIDVSFTIRECDNLKNPNRYSILQLKTIIRHHQVDFLVIQSLKRLFDSDIDRLNFKAFMEYYHVRILANE